MCDDCRKTTIDCHSGTAVVEVSGWGSWNIWLDTEPEPPALPSVLLSPRDALRLAWTLATAAYRLWRLQRRHRREYPVVAGKESGQ